MIAMPLGYVYNPWFFYPLLWSVLFFGACIMPTATGIIVNSVPRYISKFKYLNREHQAATSSFSQLLYNILGFFASPFLSGLIMTAFSNEDEGLIWG
jgi:MFS family permease